MKLSDKNGIVHKKYFRVFVALILMLNIYFQIEKDPLHIKNEMKMMERTLFESSAWDERT